MIDNGFYAVFGRECIRLISKPIYIFTIIIAPLFCYLFFLSLMSKGLPTNLPVAVVDLDKSSFSRNVIRQLNSFSSTEVALEASNFTEANNQLQQGKVYAIYLIPNQFMHHVLNGESPKITFYTNNSFYVAGSMVNKDMKTISVIISGAVGRQTRLAKGQNLKQATAQLQPIVIDSHAIGNPWLNYSVYLNNMLLPGILQLMVMLMTVYSIGIEIKEQSTKEWIAKGNNSILISILGKLLPQAIIFSTMGILFQVLLYKYLQFPLHNGLPPMIVAVILFIIASQCLGLFLISLLPVLRLALSAASLLGILSISLAGFSFPVFSMSTPLQWFSQVIPLRHYFLIYVDQALNGYEIYYSRFEYIALALFILIPIPFATKLKHSLLNKQYKM